MKSYRKRPVAVLIIIMFLLMNAAIAYGTQDYPRANSGFINLRSYNFKKNGPVILSGEWAFHWGVLVDEENFQRLSEMRPAYYHNVPGYWNTLTKYDSSITPHGIATYMIKIDLGPNDRDQLALRFQNVTPNADIYINGIRLIESGVVHADQKISKSGNRPRIIPLYPLHESPIVLAVGISNYHFIKGGLNKPIQIGLYDDLLLSRERILVIDAFFLGGLMLMGLYQLALFFLNRKRKTTLFMALICFLALMFSGFRNEMVLLSLFPGWEGETTTKILYLTLALVPPMISLYTSNLYPLCFKKSFHLLFIPIGIIAFFTILFTDKSFFTRLTLFFEILIVSATVYNLVVLIIGYFRTKERPLLIFLGGLPFLFLSIAIGIMDDVNPHPIQWAGGIAFVFIFYQTFIQAYSYSHVFDEIDDLSLQKIKLEKRNIELFNLSYIDSLTGICNRRLMDDYLASNWRVNSLSERSLGIILIDIDNLKAFNDYYGQRKGDLCIMKVCELIREGLGEDDRYTLSRYGGDEFSLIVSDVDEMKLFQLAETIRKNVESAGIEHSSSLLGVVTISLGCVSFIPDIEQTYDVILDAASSALYRAKKLGRNRTNRYGVDKGLELWQPIAAD